MERNPPKKPSRNEKQLHSSLFSDQCPKTWPQLVGHLGDDAVKVIRAEMPEVNVIQIIYPPWALTQDFRPSRVRILVDNFNKVSKPPSVG